MFIETDASIDADSNRSPPFFLANFHQRMIRKKFEKDTFPPYAPKHGCIGIVTAAVVHDNDLLGPSHHGKSSFVAMT